MQKTATIVYDAKYDILKLILSVMVIIIHANVYPRLLYPWLRIAVPLFFIMSSYFLFSKLQNISVCDQWKIVKKYAVKNIGLYCFWSAALLPFTLYIRRESYFSQTWWQGLINYFWDFLFGAGFISSWFIPASVVGVVIIWWVSTKGKFTTICLISLASFCIVTLWSSYQSIFQKYPTIIKIMSSYSNILRSPVYSFPAAIFWIFIGKNFSERSCKKTLLSTNLFLLLISSAALYLEWRFVQCLDGSFNNDSYFMLAPVCISFFACFQKIRTISYQNTIYVRQASTVIYVTHVALINIVNFLYRRLLCIDSPLLTFITVVPCCLLIYLVINFVRQRYKGCNFVDLLKFSC